MCKLLKEKQSCILNWRIITLMTLQIFTAKLSKGV